MYILLVKDTVVQNTNIYLNETLTKDKSNLFYNIRKLRTNKYISKTWVYKGEVYILTKVNIKTHIFNLTHLKHQIPTQDIN